MRNVVHTIVGVFARMLSDVKVDRRSYVAPVGANGQRVKPFNGSH